MTSFSTTIVVLAAVVSPGVLLVFCFFMFSRVKRTSISFGPAMDIAIFFSLSLLINTLYGGFIAWVLSIGSSPSGGGVLPRITCVVNQLGYGATQATGCAAGSAAGLLYGYLTSLCFMACMVGIGAVYLVETLRLGAAHGVFTGVANVGSGATICSVLCKFGGENSFVIYYGELSRLQLDDKQSINYLSITGATRSLLRVGDTISASDLEEIPAIGPGDEFVIPGSSIENLSLTELNYFKQGRLRRMAAVLAIAACLLAPIAVSVKVYRDAALATGLTQPHHGSSAPPRPAKGPIKSPAKTSG